MKIIKEFPKRKALYLEAYPYKGTNFLRSYQSHNIPIQQVFKQCIFEAKARYCSWECVILESINCEFSFLHQYLIPILSGNYKECSVKATMENDVLFLEGRFQLYSKNCVGYVKPEILTF